MYLIWKHLHTDFSDASTTEQNSKRNNNKNVSQCEILNHYHMHSATHSTYKNNNSWKSCYINTVKIFIKFACVRAHICIFYNKFTFLLFAFFLMKIMLCKLKVYSNLIIILFTKKIKKFILVVYFSFLNSFTIFRVSIYNNAGISN